LNLQKAGMEFLRFCCLLTLDHSRDTISTGVDLSAKIKSRLPRHEMRVFKQSLYNSTEYLQAFIKRNS